MAKGKGKRRKLEPFEVNLLKEKKHLLALGHSWHIFVLITEKALDEGSEFLDKDLVVCIEQALQNVKGLLYYGAVFTSEDGEKQTKVKPIAKWLEEVTEVIKATQAGKPLKKGGPVREEVDSPPPSRGGAESTEDEGEGSD